MPQPGLQHPGPDHRLGSLQARAAAAQRPGRFRRQPAYLGGLLPARSRHRAPLSALRHRERTRAGARPRLADLLVHLRHLLADRRELRVPGDLPVHLLRLPGSQLPANGGRTPGDTTADRVLPVACGKLRLGRVAQQ
jgi:hypothetical protein